MQLWTLTVIPAAAGERVLLGETGTGRGQKREKEVTVMFYHGYPEMPRNPVEPSGLEPFVIYSFENFDFTDGEGIDYDYARLVVCMQGLINRNTADHHVAVHVRLNRTDDFWLEYMQEEGATYAPFRRQVIRDKEELFRVFLPFIRSCGLAVWDPDVPASANVASTLCGLESCLPVRFCEKEGSLYRTLTETYAVPVRKDFCGMFEHAALGSRIGSTDLWSTGSSKCDAYRWALENLFDRCNPEFVAYTLDGATSIPDHPIRKANPGQGFNASVTGIFNHDYFVEKQMFFVDLTPYGGEQPNDDPQQPLGADARMLTEILMRRYERAGGKYGIFVGFPPWHVKYTSFADPRCELAPPRLEWMFVELCTSYNCGTEADAPHPCWMSNASLYANYRMRYKPRGNDKSRAAACVYDKDTKYYSFIGTGDFDCSPWFKERIPEVWNDPKLGLYPIAHAYNLNLVDRVPMIFDYIFERQTANDYILGGEGVGYVIPEAFHEGFIGKEANPNYGLPSGFGKATDAFAVRRILPDGNRAYIDYSKPYYENLKVDMVNRMICGWSYLSTPSMKTYNELAPEGTFMENWSAGAFDLQLYEGVVYARTTGGFPVAEKTYEGFARGLLEGFRGKRYGETDFNHQFVAIVAPNIENGSYKNYATPSSVACAVEAFERLVAKENPEGKYQYVDPYTFMALAKQSPLCHERRDGDGQNGNRVKGF